MALPVINCWRKTNDANARLLPQLRHIVPVIKKLILFSLFVFTHSEARGTTFLRRSLIRNMFSSILHIQSRYLNSRVHARPPKEAGRQYAPHAPNGKCAPAVSSDQWLSYRLTTIDIKALFPTFQHFLCFNISSIKKMYITDLKIFRFHWLFTYLNFEIFFIDLLCSSLQY